VREEKSGKAKALPALPLPTALPMTTTPHCQGTGIIADHTSVHLQT